MSQSDDERESSSASDRAQAGERPVREGGARAGEGERQAGSGRSLLAARGPDVGAGGREVGPTGAEVAAGFGRRRRRLSDEETERRMLQAAVAMANETGLTVSLDHISFEDVIRDARVSRSTVYRRWPYKDLFFSDLLKELAKAATPAAIAGEESAVPALGRVIIEHLDWLRTPELRHALVLELIRRGSLHDFEAMCGSTEWRTYLALHTTYLSVADETLRSELQEALARSERDFVRRIAAGWERIARLFGYRLRPELGATFEAVATLASADMRGLVILALTAPELAERAIRTKPFGAVEEAEWSLSALGAAALAQAFLEPDPAVVWNEERIAEVRRLVESDGLLAF